MSPLGPAGRRGLGFRLAGVILLGAMSAAGESTIEEYQLKGGFIYNIAKFVEWPAGALASPGDPLVGCILGESPIGAALEQATRDREINGRKLAIRPIPDAQQTSGCSFLFVSLSAQKAWRAALSKARLNGILTIGEGDVLDGVIVNLKRDGDKIRIQIDLDAARRGQIQISSRLLSLSEIVKR
jgi:uncharacterized protein YdbL (DUF1318 family)